jgi:hypothetical protein
LLLRRYSSFLHISLVLTWNMILFEAKYHFRIAIFIGTIFWWNVFLFWVIWFSYSSNKMSTLDIIVKDYDKNIVLRDCQRQTFEYLHKKLSHDRSLHDYVCWDYFWDAYRAREPVRTDNYVWEIVREDAWIHSTSLILQLWLYINLTLPSLECLRSCICVLGVSMLSHSTILSCWFMVFNDTFNIFSVISSRSALWVW